MLLARGATDDVVVADRLLGACRRADRASALALVADEPGLVASVGSELVDVAGRPGADPVVLMLELGFSIDARDGQGQTPLHAAAYAGRTETVRLLLDAGAEVDAHDTVFDASPLAHAAVGSGEAGDDAAGDRSGDWVGTVRLLLDAGASRAGVWVDSKPPSDEVAAVLRRAGVAAPAGELPTPVGEGPAAGVSGGSGGSGTDGSPVRIRQMDGGWVADAQQVLDGLQERLTARHLPALLELFEDPAVLIGAAGDGRTPEARAAYLESLVVQPVELRWDWREKALFFESDEALGFAAFGELVLAHGVDETRAPIRATFFAIRTDGGWRLREFHASIPQSPG